MQDSNIDHLDVNKRQTHSEKYEITSPLDDGTLDLLHEQTQARQQIKQLTKTEKSVLLCMAVLDECVSLKVV